MPAAGPLVGLQVGLQALKTKLATLAQALSALVPAPAGPAAPAGPGVPAVLKRKKFTNPVTLLEKAAIEELTNYVFGVDEAGKVLEKPNAEFFVKYLEYHVKGTGLFQPGSYNCFRGLTPTDKLHDLFRHFEACYELSIDSWRRGIFDLFFLEFCLSKFNGKEKELTYASLGSGCLGQDFKLIDLLARFGFTFKKLIFIDTNYAGDVFNNVNYKQRFQEFANWFKSAHSESFKDTEIYAYSNSEDYCRDCTVDPSMKCDILTSIDVHLPQPKMQADLTDAHKPQFSVLKNLVTKTLTDTGWFVSLAVAVVQAQGDGTMIPLNNGSTYRAPATQEQLDSNKSLKAGDLVPHYRTSAIAFGTKSGEFNYKLFAPQGSISHFNHDNPASDLSRNEAFFSAHSGLEGFYKKYYNHGTGVSKEIPLAERQAKIDSLLTRYFTKQGNFDSYALL